MVIYLILQRKCCWLGIQLHTTALSSVQTHTYRHLLTHTLFHALSLCITLQTASLSEGTCMFVITLVQTELTVGGTKMHHVYTIQDEVVDVQGYFIVNYLL